MVIIVTQVNGAEVLDGGGKPLRRRQVKTLGCDGDGKKSDVVVHVCNKKAQSVEELRGEIDGSNKENHLLDLNHGRPAQLCAGNCDSRVTP